MKYRIDSTRQRPAYLQLYDQLKNDIIGGVYAAGSKLPSKRTLAAEVGLSVIPIEHAYALLCDEGYVESRQRSGYFVIYQEDDFGRFFDTPREYLPKTSTVAPASPGGGTFSYPTLAKAMRKVMADYQERLLIKSPNRGCAELRGAIASYLLRSGGMRVRPEQIVIGSGAEYLYTLIAQLFGGERHFAIEEPSYEKIACVYRVCGVSFDRLMLGADGIRTDELERTEATVLHVTPFHSFPSGVTADASKRREYIRFAEQRQGYIIEDNYDSELTVSKKNEDSIFSAANGGRVIYLNTFSHTVAPSIRVGYMILPDALLSVFEERLGFCSCTVPLFEQLLLAELLRNGDFERHINRVRRKRRKSGI